MYLDFKKIPDTVFRKRLLREKYNYEVRGKISQWIKNWINDGKKPALKVFS